MVLFKSVYEYGEAEYVIEKSRFIAHVQPVSSYEEAQEFVAEIKNEYRNATHNVPAVIVGAKQEIQWASDDGEPSGTSGLPMLKMIADEGLTNLVVVVTRYFGGIKLGTGGLSRAYTAVAKIGIEQAGKCEVRSAVSCVYEMDYSCLSRLQKQSKEKNFEVSNVEYTDKITVTLDCETEIAEDVKRLVADMTSGQAVQISEKNCFKRFRI